MTAIAFTMVYNERENLPRWLRHYGAHVGRLLVLDHGSDDGSTEDLAIAERIRIPRSPPDAGLRVALINDMQRHLLRHHAAVVYTDCDELIVPDPRVFPTLAAYIEHMREPFARPAGFNVVHQRESEPPLDPMRPVLAQRALIQFRSPMCKPVVARQPIRWTPGLHDSDYPVAVDPHLWLFHTKWADHSAALRRLAVTRSMAWTDRALASNSGAHQRQSDAEHTADRFDAVQLALQAQGGLARLPATQEVTYFNRCLALEADGFWRVPFFAGRVFGIEPFMRELV